MNELKIHVERVVRPIRASNRRKCRMREELLAHLTCMAEQEQHRTKDDGAAVAAAIRRFGDADALRDELQASVPVVERIGLVDLVGLGPMRRRQGEAPVRYIVRSNIVGFAFACVGFSLFALAIVAIFGQRPQRLGQPGTLHLLGFVFATLVIQCGTTTVIGLLSEAMRRALDSRASATSPRAKWTATVRLAVYCLAGSVLIAVASAALMAAIDWFVPIPFITPVYFWWITLGAAALGGPLLFWQAVNWRATNQRFEDWESLDLETTHLA